MSSHYPVGDEERGPSGCFLPLERVPNEVRRDENDCIHLAHPEAVDGAVAFGKVRKRFVRFDGVDEGQISEDR